MRYVFVKPKPRVSAQGRHNRNNPDGSPVESVKAKGAKFTFSILKKRDGILNTGLDYYVPNPYKAESAEKANLPLEWKDTDIWSRERITRQEEIEIEHHLSPGTLTHIPSRNRKEPTYLELFRYTLEDRENRVSLEDLKGKIFYEAAKVSMLIASSKEDAMNSPFAHFYISHVNEDEESKASKNRTLAKANAALEDLQTKHGPTRTRQVAIILKLLKLDTVPEEAVYNRLFDFINHEKKYRQNISKFNDVVDMLSNKTKKHKFDALFLLRELTNYRVLNEERGAFYWSSKRGTSLGEIGRTEEAALNFLMDKGNEPYVQELTQELKIKKNDY